MKPFALASDRLLLDEPRPSDAELVTAYCQDPLFELYITTPWPYTRANADYFLETHVPEGWRSDREYTWAIRFSAGSPLVGVICLRPEGDGAANFGYWLGAEHRGNSIMTEAMSLVRDWALGEHTGFELLRWECIVGNASSAAVAMRNGFTFTGESPAEIVARDGSHPLAWHGTLARGESLQQKQGWPL